MGSLYGLTDFSFDKPDNYVEKSNTASVYP